jgi:hypothetical protein
MLRADVTRDEVKQLRLIALTENKTSQALIGELIRARIAQAASA